MQLARSRLAGACDGTSEEASTDCADRMAGIPKGPGCDHHALRDHSRRLQLRILIEETREHTVAMVPGAVGAGRPATSGCCVQLVMLRE